MATAAGTAIALSTSIGAAPAVASATALPEGTDQATYTQMLAQARLVAAADQIQQAATAPGAGHDGLFDTWVDTGGHSVTLYWHGAMPADIAQLVNALRTRVTVKVAAARFSMAQLDAAVDAGVHTSAAVSGHPLTDGSGIELDFNRDAANVSASSLSASLGVPVVTGAALSATPMATCIPTNRAALPAPSRCDDQSPNFWGGNVIINLDSGSGCSTAFGVHGRTGGTFLVTAAHCSENQNGARVNGIQFENGDGTQFVGASSFVPGPHDAALISTSAGNRYYDGPGIRAGDTHNTKLVVGQGGVFKGASYCESGAFGGVKCGWVVVNLNVGNLGTGCPGSGFDEAVSTNGSTIIGGDSGGPVFTLVGTAVSARGVNDCLGVDGNGVSHLFFTPIETVTADTGATVNT